MPSTPIESSCSPSLHPSRSDSPLPFPEYALHPSLHPSCLDSPSLSPEFLTQSSYSPVVNGPGAAGSTPHSRFYEEACSSDTAGTPGTLFVAGCT